MPVIDGRIGKKFVDLTFSETQALFKEKDKIHKKMTGVWFIYFQRISKRLKTCDAVMFDGKELIEFTTSQKNIEEISDAATCPIYIGSADPMPWKRFLREATKHKWQREDWQHMFEYDSESEENSESDADWKPPSDSESEEDDSSDEEDNDEQPPAKRACRRQDE